MLIHVSIVSNSKVIGEAVAFSSQVRPVMFMTPDKLVDYGPRNSDYSTAIIINHIRVTALAAASTTLLCDVDTLGRQSNSKACPQPRNQARARPKLMRLCHSIPTKICVLLVERVRFKQLKLLVREQAALDWAALCKLGRAKGS